MEKWCHCYFMTSWIWREKSDMINKSNINRCWVQFSSVAQSCPTLCNLMNRNMPGLLSITNSQSPPKPMSIVSVMPSNHLILCYPLLLPPSIIPSIRVFSNELALCIRWPEYWIFSFSISPSNEYSELPGKPVLYICPHIIFVQKQVYFIIFLIC